MATRKRTAAKLHLLTVREMQAAKEGDHRDGGGLLRCVKGEACPWSSGTRRPQAAGARWAWVSSGAAGRRKPHRGAPELLEALSTEKPLARARNVKGDTVPQTLQRIRQRLDAVFEDAIFHAHCTGNPAATIRRKMLESLPRKRPGHEPAGLGTASTRGRHGGALVGRHGSTATGG